MQWARKQNGFTIVELLIVVVVIAILAAITIVAYNGIQNRAKQSAAQTAVSQANRKILAYAIQNGDQYPADLAAAGITNTEGLEYSVNNDATPRTYGITATNGAFSYYMSNSTSQPAEGGYAGHSANGVVAVRNLVLNPQPTSAVLWKPSSETVGTLAFTTGSNGRPAVRTTRVSSGNYALYYNRDADGIGAVTTGNTFTVLATITSSKNLTYAFQVGIYPGSTSISSLTMNMNLTANQPYNLHYTFTIPDGYSAQPIGLKFFSNTGAVNDWFEVSDVMVVAGTYDGQYADGNSLNWAWAGTPNNSTSTGRPL